MSDDDSSEPEWVTQHSASKAAALPPSSQSSSPYLSADEGGGEAGDGDPKKRDKKAKAKAPPASSLPLLLAPKVRRDVLLLETADPSLDLSGDFGTIGRLSVNAGAGGSSSQGAVSLDLKGKVSDGDVVPCNTMCILSIDGAKARIETVFSDFVQLQPPKKSIMDMETVHEGELGDDFFDDGEVEFNDDSDEEAGPLREGKAKSDAKGKGKGKAKPKAKPKAGSKGIAKKPPAKKAAAKPKK